MADTSLQIVISAKDQFSATANKVVGSLNRIQGSAGQVGKGVGQLAGGLVRLGAVAATAAAGGLIFAAKAAIDFEDAFAGVRKTADLTEAEFTQLATAFRKMATTIPIGANELARLGETAGALGITGVANIQEFARVTALLGVTTNLTADAAAESLGHISTILKLTGEDYQRFASALVDLGNKGASTEDQIAAIAERAAGGAASLRLSTPDLLGWSAAIANLGVEAEAGGTNLQAFFMDAIKFTAEAGDEMRTLAEVSGLTVAQWKAEFGTNPGSALSQFIVGLGKLNGEQQILALGMLGWDDRRIARALTGLAANTDNLTDALANSNAAWDANTALSVEAQKRFDTLKSKLQILRNNFIEAAMIVGEGFTPALGRAAEKLTKFLQIDANRTSLRKLGEDIGRAIDAIDWQQVISGAKTFLDIVKTIATALMAIPNEIKAAGLAFLGLNKLSGGLIGQGLGNIAGGLAGAATRGIAAKLPGIGQVFAQPVFVTNWPLGGLGGGVAPGGKGGVPPIVGAGGAAAAAGGLGVGAILGGLAAGAAAASVGLLALGEVVKATSTSEQLAEGERRRREQQIFKLTGGRTTVPGGLAPAPIAAAISGGLSPDERQIFSDQTRAFNRQYDALERIRTAITTPRPIPLSPDERQELSAIRSASDRVYTAVENTRSAIFGLTIPPPSVNVTVNAAVSIRDVTRRTTATLRIGRLTAQ